eukprot:EG_transcript_35878
MSDILLQLVQFVNAWAPFHQLHRVDFCVSKLSTTIPDHWTAAMVEDDGESCPLALTDAILFGRTPESWPSDLREFVETSVRLRSPHGSHKVEAMPLDNLWGKGMGQKKLHEVQHMAWCMRRVMQASGCSHILDVGSGKGHLSNVLAHHPALGYSVCAVDSNEANVAYLNKLGLQA